MKGKDVTEGALLWWQSRKYGFGDKVRVIDPRPVYGRSSRWSGEYAAGHGTGVLVDVLDGKGDVLRRTAAQLRHLLGPYDEVKREQERKRRATEQYEADRRRRGERLNREAARLQRQARKRGLVVWAQNKYDQTISVSLSAVQFEAMLNALPDGWTPPPDPEEE